MVTISAKFIPLVGDIRSTELTVVDGETIGSLTHKAEAAGLEGQSWSMSVYIDDKEVGPDSPRPSITSGSVLIIVEREEN